MGILIMSHNIVIIHSRLEVSYNIVAESQVTAAMRWALKAV